jgi:hypothetical protein
MSRLISWPRRLSKVRTVNPLKFVTVISSAPLVDYISNGAEFGAVDFGETRAASRFSSAPT